MLARIESSFAVREASEERMRQFVADASHELRTRWRRCAGTPSCTAGSRLRPAVRQVGDGRIEAESDRMSGLVEDLLLQPASTTSPTSRSAVDLTVLAADAVADARAQAPERRIALLGSTGRSAPPSPVARSRDCGRSSPASWRTRCNTRLPAPPSSSRWAPPTTGRRARGARPRSGRPSGGGDEGVRALLPGRPRAGPSAGGGSGLGLAIVADRRPAPWPRGVAQTSGGGATFVVRLPQQTPSH